MPLHFFVTVIRKWAPFHAEHTVVSVLDGVLILTSCATLMKLNIR